QTKCLRLRNLRQKSSLADKSCGLSRSCKCGIRRSAHKPLFLFAALRVQGNCVADVILVSTFLSLPIKPL
ncbi:mCG145618, partial [Mus musculus]